MYCSILNHVTVTVLMAQGSGRRESMGLVSSKHTKKPRVFRCSRAGCTPDWLATLN
jgi:hypothetical protein